MTFENDILCGLRDQMPHVVRITSAGAERRHAIRCTLYRRADEIDGAFLYRVLARALTLNLRCDEFDPFSWMLGGTIFFDYDGSASDEDYCDDEWVNAKRRLAHQMEYGKQAMGRIDAAWRLAQMIGIAPSPATWQ
jgi:hypothetical protein